MNMKVVPQTQQYLPPRISCGTHGKPRIAGVVVLNGDAQQQQQPSGCALICQSPHHPHVGQTR